MTFAVAFHPSAVIEVEEAETWYSAERAALADAFIADLEASVARVATNPFGWAERWPGVRQAQLRRFPYLVVFRLRGEAVDVVAVAHSRRAPR